MKTLVKKLFLCFNAIVHRDTLPKVVFYHDIGQKYTPMGTPEALFRAHMTHLRELENRGRGRDGVALDDGFRGLWDHREMLREYDIHPIVFIAIALVGQPGYLTWNEIRTLQNEYGVNFQCHTWSHQTLAGPVNTDLPIPSDPNFRTDEWYHHELVDSKTELERQLNLSSLTSTSNLDLGHKVSALCFPVGYFSDDVIRRCVDAGYTELYASFPGNKDDDKSILDLDLFARPDVASCRIIPRCLCQFASLFEFKAILKGGMNPLRNRYFRMHYVEDGK